MHTKSNTWYAIGFLDKKTNQFLTMTEKTIGNPNKIQLNDTLTTTYHFGNMEAANNVFTTLKNLAPVDISIHIKGTHIADLAVKADILNNLVLCEHKSIQTIKEVSNQQVAKLLEIELTKQRMIEYIRNLSMTDCTKLANTVLAKKVKAVQ